MLIISDSEVLREKNGLYVCNLYKNLSTSVNSCELGICLELRN